jgi:DNA helicase-4
MNEEKIYVNGYPLDDNQKNAVMSSAKYNMIIAGAGSGKTLTMVGKIEYLLKVKNVKPEEILCISFTNEAVNSLKCKINNPKINVYTFHKLAITLLDYNNFPFLLTKDNFLSETIDKFFKQNITNTFLRKQIKIVFKIPIYSPKYILNNKNYKEIKKQIISFINLYNAHNLSMDDLKKIIIKTKKKLLYIIFAIINFYEQEKARNNYLDFDDLIKEAISAENTPNIKEIIVDEFQDTSLLRLNFLKAIINKTDANLTVVGDDFQSIYKFSGCSLDIFLNFQNYFPNAKLFKLENTYRNSNELIKIAGSFVMKNKKQVVKNLKSNKNLENPIKIVYYFNRYNALLKVIKEIKDGEILILGRNNFDIYNFIPKDDITWLNNGYFKLKNYDYNLRYLTVHKSKGLESDNVIVINLENKNLGFPSQKKSYFLNQFILKKEDFLYEEERRLFYVALTRTKNYCYLLVPYLNPSIFIREVKELNG